MNNISLSNYIKAGLLLAGFYAQSSYGQNTPQLSQTAPSGSTNIFQPPPVIPFTNNITGDYNYTRTYAPKVPFTNSLDITTGTTPDFTSISTTFRDGFNRDMQTTVRNYTNTASPHLIQPIDGRFQQDGYSYLPYGTSTNASTNPDPQATYLPDPFAMQQAFYNGLYPGEGYTPFSRERYISDANQRSTVNYAPGKSQVGQNRGTTTQVITNNASQIRMWALDGNGKPVSSGFYPADVLYGILTTSSEGSTVTSYKDKDGSVICQITYLEDNGSGGGVTPVYGTTYYVYDEMGRLRYTIPPKAADLISGGTLTQAILDDLCFQYRYDNRGRKIAQWIPGKSGWEEFIYDKKNRLVFYRDPNLTANSKWTLTVYDALDRVLMSGIYTGVEDRATIQNSLDDPNVYTPSTIVYYQKNYALMATYPSGTWGCEALIYNYYDDYQLADPNGTAWNTYTNALQFSEQVNVTGSETPWVSYRSCKGKVTGSKVKILTAPDADPAKTGEWRETVNFYDEKGRPIYIVSKDLYQGNAIHAHYTGTQYDFSNKVLINKHVMSNTNATGTTSHSELNRNVYDINSGQLTSTRHRVNSGSFVTQATFTYDDLGRVKRKVLGNFGEIQDYNYNIRGQLSGINDYYARTGDRQGESRTFGEMLSYDYGFTQPRTDGKVAGMVWRGSGSALAHAYGYSYDKGGRLTLADYHRGETPPILPPTITWTKANADYTTSNLKYDKNGNLLSMDQKGVKPGTGIVDMDQLKYYYANGGQSNQLLTVTDNAAFHDLGDFNNTNGTNADYSYDVNGNIIADDNKGISFVTYNHFNRPQTVTLLGGKKIAYSYDALGNKVQELVIDPAQPVKRTDYIGNFSYENDVLQYVQTTDGRTVRDNGNNSFKEEYFVKDHLGNIRSVIDVTVYPIQEYLATYEVASANLEGLFFDNMDEVRDDKPGGTPEDNKAGNLYGSDPARRIGTSALMKVMAGDKLEMNVNNYYENYNAQDDDPVYPEDMLASIITTLTEGVGGWVGGESHDTKLVGDAFTNPNYFAFNDLVNSSTDPDKPKAYLNYLFFNERMELVPELSGSFQANGAGTWTQIGTAVPMEIVQNGYLAVYLSNSSKGINCEPCSHVYFDQLILRYSRGNLKEEAHYYPHGLPIAGMGSAAAGFKDNRRKYQSNEYIRSVGLNWMDFNNRQYDPQIGRFLSVDPMAASTINLSPYVGMNNNPVSIVDPWGLQGKENLTHLPFNTVSPFPTMLRMPGEKQGWGEGINPNAPGGSAGWFFQLGLSLGNDAATGREARGGNDPGATREQLVRDGWVVDGEDATSLFAHRWDANLNRTDANFIKGTGQTTWEGSNPFSDPSTNYFYGTLTPALVGSFVNDTRFGRWASMGGTSFTTAPYSLQKALMQDFASTSKYVSVGVKGVGYAGAVLTVASDAVGVYNFVRYGPNSANAVSPWHAAVDVGASYIGIYGGWPGAVISGAYFAASPVIWFTPGPTFPTTVPTVDETYVAPR